MAKRDVDVIWAKLKASTNPSRGMDVALTGKVEPLISKNFITVVASTSADNFRASAVPGPRAPQGVLDEISNQTQRLEELPRNISALQDPSVQTRKRALAQIKVFQFRLNWFQYICFVFN
jgi:hypothetical protein